MTIRKVHHQFWQDFDAGTLGNQLANIYYFYLFGEPLHVMDLSEEQDVEDITFIPIGG